mgnify:CR=1 FL=1
MFCFLFLASPLLSAKLSRRLAEVRREKKFAHSLHNMHGTSQPASPLARSLARCVLQAPAVLARSLQFHVVDRLRRRAKFSANLAQPCPTLPGPVSALLLRSLVTANVEPTGRHRSRQVQSAAAAAAGSILPTLGRPKLACLSVRAARKSRSQASRMFVNHSIRPQAGDNVASHEVMAKR